MNIRTIATIGLLALCLAAAPAARAQTTPDTTAAPSFVGQLLSMLPGSSGWHLSAGLGFLSPSRFDQLSALQGDDVKTVAWARGDFVTSGHLEASLEIEQVIQRTVITGDRPDMTSRFRLGYRIF